MTAILLTTAEEFEVLNNKHVAVKVTGRRLGDFGAHRRDAVAPGLFGSEYTISHLPSGRALATGFPTLEQAAEAMREVVVLRNDWSAITGDNINLDLRLKVDAIVKRFGGFIRTGRDGAPIRPHLNGYESEAL